MRSQLDAVWERLDSDRSLGSTELALETLESIDSYLENCSSINHDTGQTIARKLRRTRPEMTLLVNLGHLLGQRLHDSPELTFKEHIRKMVRDLIKRLNQSQESIRHAVDDLPFELNKVAIFSRSGVILKLMKSVDELSRLSVLESHPGKEGISLANQLADTLPVRFVYDAEAPTVLNESNLLLLGADSFDENGTVLNKTGSSLMARATQDTPVVVCCQSLKYTDLDSIDGPTLKSPDDLDQRLQRRHNLFETVNSTLIDYYATDRGLFTVADRFIESVDDVIEARNSVLSN